MNGKPMRNQSRYTILIAICFLLFTLPTALIHGESNEREADAKPVILCSTTQIYDFTKQIAGDDCDVYCVIAPGTNPHSYQPTPGDAQRASSSALCIQNGLHLEGKNWMATLAGDAGSPIVTCTDGIKPLILDIGGESVKDPHAWFDPENAAIYVKNITYGLVKIDPTNKEKYMARAGLYLSELRVLDSWIRRQVNKIPPEKRILVTSHDAFNYFAHTYGFRAEAPVGWSTGSEVGAGMTPSRRRAVISSIREFGVPAIFIESSVNPKVIREIAGDAGVRIGGELYSDSMGEAGSSGETYIGMMKENVLTILISLSEGE